MSENTTEAIDAQAVQEVQAAVRVVKGNPSDQEIAALVTVLAAAAGSSAPPADTRPRELWGTPASMHRTFGPFSPYSYAASQRY